MVAVEGCILNGSGSGVNVIGGILIQERGKTTSG